MAHPEESHISADAPAQPGGMPHGPAGDDSSRRLPFILRVATIWTNKDELPSADEGQLRYWKRAPLTGNIVTTSGGQDVSFSDLEV